VELVLELPRLKIKPTKHQAPSQATSHKQSKLNGSTTTLDLAIYQP